MITDNIMIKMKMRNQRASFMQTEKLSLLLYMREINKYDKKKS